MVPMTDEGRPTPDPGGPEGSSFTLVGRIKRWDPTARELTIGGRILRVADSVLFVSDLIAGISIMASGYQPPGPSNRWVVTHLRVG
jgi:hypothetical protein